MCIELFGKKCTKEEYLDIEKMIKLFKRFNLNKTFDELAPLLNFKSLSAIRNKSKSCFRIE
jgi:hypothetical protein